MMMKTMYLLLFVWFNAMLSTRCSQAETSGELDFYSFTVMDIYENIISLEQYRGKVSLVVNVASQCGYTDNHYKSFVRLQELLEDTNRFNVLAFPCNQFGQQEPGSNLDILDFVTETYGVNFPMFAKVNVKGIDALDAWKYLSDKSGHEPEWNFWKYLVDGNGKLVDAWGPWSDPDKLYNIITLTIRRAEREEAEKKKAKTEADKEKDKTEADKEKDKTEADKEKDKTEVDKEKDKTEADKEKDKTEADKEKDKTEADKEKDKTEADKEKDKTEADKEKDETEADKEKDKTEVGTEKEEL